MTNKIQTKYGIIYITEDEQGAVRVSFNTDDDVMIEMKANNSLVFHILEPRTKNIKTKLNLKKIGSDE